MIINLDYKNFNWIKNNAAKNGFNPLSFYAESLETFDLRFYFEGVWYKCVVNKRDIPFLTSRFSNVKNEEIINLPIIPEFNEVFLNETELLPYIDKFRKEELFDYMKVLSYD